VPFIKASQNIFEISINQFFTEGSKRSTQSQRLTLFNFDINIRTQKLGPAFRISEYPTAASTSENQAITSFQVIKRY